MIKGVMIGKFMPLHKGHELLLNFGKNFCDYFTILVDNYEPSEISLEDRFKIVDKQLSSYNTKVVAIDEIMPQNPDDCEDFWNIWKEGILRNTGYKPDYIIGSESYVFKLAEVLGCEPLVIDNNRDMITTSGTEIRTNPYSDKNWDNLTQASKEYFCKKICVIGAESTGKSTLTKYLSNNFGTVYAEEFARFFLEGLNREIEYKDMETIAKGQLALMNSMFQNGAKMIFNDTDLITTKIWSLKLFNKYPAILDKLIKKQQIDYYLLTKINTCWIQDGIRYFESENDRIWFFEQFKKELDYYGCKYDIVEGDSFEEKNSNAIQLINKFKKEEMGEK